MHTRTLAFTAVLLLAARDQTGSTVVYAYGDDFQIHRVYDDSVNGLLGCVDLVSALRDSA